MMRKPFIQLIAAFIFVAILIAAYSAWFVIVDRENAKAAALATQIELQSQDTARVAAAKAALASLTSDESRVNMHFVPATDVVPFIETLQSTGASLGSRVVVLSVSAVPGKARGQLALSLQITGSFDSVMRTLGALEYSPYDITLGGVTLSTPGAAGKGARTWQAGASFTVGTASMTPGAARLPAPSTVIVPAAAASITPVTPAIPAATSSAPRTGPKKPTLSP